MKLNEINAIDDAALLRKCRDAEISPCSTTFFEVQDERP